MKIKVELTVKLDDPADWTLAFGIEGAAQIREDVREYVTALVDGAGVFGNGEVPATVHRKRTR